jgi:hypothetical protein
MCSPSNDFRKHLNIEALDLVDDRDSFETIRDTQPIEEGAQRVSLFPSQPHASEILADYGGNPLNGQYGRTVVGASIELTTPIIQSTDRTAVDPAAILNAFQQALLRVRADNGSKILLREPAKSYMNLSAAEVTNTVNPDGTGYLHQLHVPTMPDFKGLNTTFGIASQQSFDVDIEFAEGDGGAFGAAGDYTLGQPGLQVAFRVLVPNLDD